MYVHKRVDSLKIA